MMRMGSAARLIFFCMALAVVAAAAESNLLPNGSFEHWHRFSEKALGYKRNQLWTADPEIPMRWDVGVIQPCRLARVTDAHGGESALALTVPGSRSAGVSLDCVEILPGTDCAFGFWLKGKGKATMSVNGKAVEGQQGLGRVEGEAGEAWTRVEGRFTMPSHMRTVVVYLTAGADSDLRIDDVFLTADTASPVDASAVLDAKYGKDEHTLFYEGFDGESPMFIPTAPEVAVTDADGGRFGRGLRLDRKGSATIPLVLDAMPEEGTIEFWIAPEHSDKGMGYLALMKGKALLEFGHWPGRITVQPDEPRLRKAWSMGGSSQELDVWRMRPNQWHHLAYTWDKQTLRFYIDGALSDMKTLDRVKWPSAPSFIQLSKTMAKQRHINGIIDEIRLSDIRRYGPAIPAGGVYTAPLQIPSAVKPAAAGAAASVQGPDKESVAAQRKELLGAIPLTRPGEFESRPDADGNYIYEATSAKPIVEGGKCEIIEDKQITGLTLVRSDHGHAGLLPDHSPNAGVYWTLGDIQPGSYWIGILYQGGGSVGTYGPLTVYLNGRIVQLATQSDPVQVAPGRWFVEALAGGAEALQPGDEVGVVFRSGTPAARLILRREAPPPEFASPWRVPGNFGGHQWNHYTALGVNVEGRFRLKDGALAPNLRWNSIQQTAGSLASLKDENGKVAFSAWVANPLGVPVTVDYRCAIKTFYGDTVALDEARLTIEPHQKLARTLAFEWQEDEVTHFADITLLGVEPPDLSKSRAEGGLGWPPHESLEFFRGHRQILPWPDPFNARVIRRLTIDTPAGGARQTHSLDGGVWQMAYTTALEPPMPPPGGLEFKPANVPKGWSHPNLNSIKPRPHGAYFRRTFNLSDKEAGRSYKLVVSYAYAEATAYVNGRKVGNVRGESAPIVCDITRAIHPGQNELVIVVRDLIANMNPAYVNKQAPVGNQDYLEAPGLHGRDGLGLGSVSIESAPLVSSEDVFVITSVREGKVAAKITAANRGPEALPVRVTAEVLDDGEPVLGLGDRELTLLPHEPVEFTQERPWKDPVLWEPGQPHLYAMRVTIRNAAGEIIDVRRDRFGFRESWIDGPDIMFNGRAIKPVGYGPLHKFSPKGNFSFIRGGGRDWLDEVGILAYKGGISGVYNQSSQHNVENDLYWGTAERNTIASIKLLQNSPHILAWDISNEWLCYFWGDAMQGARRFKALSDAVRAYDPTRWTLGNAEGDFHGLLDNYSFHYMKPYFGPPNPFTMRGRTPYYPDEAYWRALDRNFEPGDTVQLCPIHPVTLDPSKKVIMDNEFLWKCGKLMPPGPTRFIGEDDVVSPAEDSASGAAAWSWKTMIDGHRDLGVSVVNHYSFHAGVLRGAHLEQALIAPENQRRGFAGTKQTRRFTVINSLFRPSKMKVTWTLTAPGGGELAREEFPYELSSGGIGRGDVAFDLPPVSKRTAHVLRAELEADGNFICTEEWDLEVWPRGAVVSGPLARRVLLFDPAHTTAGPLTALGVPFEAIDALSPLPAKPAELALIIGEDALHRFNATATAPLSRFVERGGRVVVLAQQATPAGLPVPTSLEPRNWSSQVYLRAGSHPILKGLTAEDFKFWQPDRAVGTGAYRKPFSGSFVTLLDTSFWEDMDWAQMMEVFRGDGSYVLCQLPLASRFEVEPMAGETLGRVVAYAAGGPASARPVKTLAAVTAPESEIAAVLETRKVAHRVVGAEGRLAAGLPLLLDAGLARKAGPEVRAAWAGALGAGGTILVVNAEPADSSWLSALAGTNVVITVPPYSLWDGRAFRRGWSAFTAGLSHLDLYFKRYASDERSAAQAEDSSNIIEPLQHYSVSVPGGRELIFPGVLVEVSIGNGTLLLDQRRWAPKDANLANLAARNLSSLMTALDVGMSAYEPSRALPAELATRTVSLAALVNYPLQAAADAADSPRVNLAGFPSKPGERTLRGTPFELAGGAIALAGPGADAGLPEEVVIPLGFLVEGLYFLHAAADAGDGLAANYHVIYEDGGSSDVPVKGGVQVADWNSPRHLAGAEIAWTGSTERHPIVAAYRLLWVNRRPDVAVKEVVFSNPERQAFPILIGLTAAARKETIPVAPEIAARARKAFEDGKKALASKQTERAYRLIRSAVLDDPSLQEAYPIMADAAERWGNENGIYDAYRLWSISGPRQPLPWNRMGEILEKQEKIRPAIDAFKKSLEIEWNQPPVMTAIRRLEEKLR